MICEKVRLHFCVQPLTPGVQDSLRPINPTENSHLVPSPTSVAFLFLYTHGKVHSTYLIRSVERVGEVPLGRNLVSVHRAGNGAVGGGDLSWKRFQV